MSETRQFAPAWVGWTYAIYAVSLTFTTWGLTSWAVFFEGQSGWWFALAAFMWGCGYSPWRWHAICDGVERPKDRFKGFGE